jgi:glycosyltransferase involved in cell wall biosynthesis
MNDKKVLLVSPWERNGGLSTYSHYLLEKAPKDCEFRVSAWDFESVFSRGFGLPILSLDLIRNLSWSSTVHIQYAFGRYLISAPLLIILSKFLGSKVVLTQHERFAKLTLEKLLWFYNQILYIFVDDIIVHTNNREEMVLKLHKGKTNVIPHGIIERDNVAQKPRNIETVVIPGIIRPIKGYEYAIQSLKHIDCVDLKIIGSIDDEDYYNSLRTLTDSIGVKERIQWTTKYVPESELHSIIRDADLILLPYDETTSMSGILAHCISWHNLTLVTDAPAFRSIINTNSVFIDRNDEKSIANTIKSLNSSEQMQMEIIEEFQNIASRDSWRNVSRKTAELYQ